jgi:hypothetical protein
LRQPYGGKAVQQRQDGAALAPPSDQAAPRQLGGGLTASGAGVGAPRGDEARALPETYHVASTAARIIIRTLVTQLAYFVCSPELPAITA